MEHMCFCSRHSSQISWKACAHQTPPMRGMQGPDRLMGNPITHLYAHTQSCMCTLSVFIHYGNSASYCMYSMHSTMYAQWHQKINTTRHSSRSNWPARVYIVKVCCCWYFDFLLYLYIDISIFSCINLWLYQSDFWLWWSNSQQQSLNHFLSGF